MKTERPDRLAARSDRDLSGAGSGQRAALLIVNLVPYGQGWDPINHMVRLAAELLEAELIELPARRSTRVERLLAMLARRQRAPRGQHGLLICAQPRDLAGLLDIEGWRKRFDRLAAWVIDSFWLDAIPRSMRTLRPFDHLFVTSAEDMPAWQQVTATPTRWLGWGADVLGLGGAQAAREWDLLRVGRQPPPWDDDELTARAAAAAGLRFHPRPGGAVLTPFENQRFLMQRYAQTKFVLAFSNRVNPTSYTHPHRQYLTGRWVDALASGAVVAGVRPREPSIDELLWPEATLELGGTELQGGLALIQEAARRWHPGLSATNHAWALRRLDWRWRFKVLADAFALAPPRLAAELTRLEAAIASHPVGSA
jgi:hypothetical protein